MTTAARSVLPAGILTLLNPFEILNYVRCFWNIVFGFLIIFLQLKWLKMIKRNFGFLLHWCKRSRHPGPLLCRDPAAPPPLGACPSAQFRDRTYLLSNAPERRPKMTAGPTIGASAGLCAASSTSSWGRTS